MDVSRAAKSPRVEWAYMYTQNTKREREMEKERGRDRQTDRQTERKIKDTKGVREE